MNTQSSIVGWLAAGLSCVVVLVIFYGFVFTQPNIAEHGVSIMSAIAVGSLVRAGVAGKLRRSTDQESQDG